ncbi:hypothetical protein PPERSA_07211 [Pseudocohnilembus persalinus]|uniref:MEMO1 family n=1 Tax=Pseudocohnilembus persalinus TaxID=266149 RepID=A0A0V0QDA2_PSEPJ|nr:hypothetical protein PPERSA_07211 [Pseudocohnilembus persalinus]|eukprot:KRX00104.1 hypothetical protein PPERSA_07211 [Pseudocohnilembus persalinus]
METTKNTRKALKAGTWYTAEKQLLQKELQNWLQNCKIQQQIIPQIKSFKALIGPHAGLSYCGKTGAYAYQYLINKNNNKLNVFLLGPSHRHRMFKCGLTQFDEFETPLGNIQINQQILQELAKNNDLFETLPKEADLNEHSLELHLPWIQQMLKNTNFQLIPIMVGGIDKHQMQMYGKLLAPYFDDENTVFIISSDFCHWGERFGYTFYKNEQKQGQQKKTPIYQSIQNLDKQGIQIIEKQDLKQFQQYLDDTGNTICGRRPIQILLETINQSKNKQQIKTSFLSYDQSGQCLEKTDSSVSYASLITYI